MSEEEEEINEMPASEQTGQWWKRYFMHISYDGTNYHGWQRQLNSHSVQEEIEAALRKLLRQERVVSVGCGRTDAGVHARTFYLHFNVSNDAINMDEVFFKLNLMLPKDIGLCRIWRVHDKAHARFDASERSYEYHINQVRDPFIQRFSTYYPWKLDAEKMNEAASHLLLHTDFAAFCKTGGGQKTTICDLRKAEWEVNGDRLVFHVTADRFLRNMVRALVGSMIDVGRGRISIAQFDEIIESRQRVKAGDSVPPQGLHLTRIIYPDALMQAHE